MDDDNKTTYSEFRTFDSKNMIMDNHQYHFHCLRKSNNQSTRLNDKNSKVFKVKEITFQNHTFSNASYHFS